MLCKHDCTIFFTSLSSILLSRFHINFSIKRIIVCPNCQIPGSTPGFPALSWHVHISMLLSLLRGPYISISFYLLFSPGVLCVVDAAHGFSVCSMWVICSLEFHFSPYHSSNVTGSFFFFFPSIKSWQSCCFGSAFASPGFIYLLILFFMYISCSLLYWAGSPVYG